MIDSVNTTNVEQELVKLNIEIGKAEQRREQADVDFLNQVPSDKLIFQCASMVVVNKATYLADLVKAKNTYKYLYSEFPEAKGLAQRFADGLLKDVCAAGFGHRLPSDCLLIADSGLMPVIDS